MTLAEYGACFEGFSQRIGAPPGHKQWECIKRRVKEIDGTPVGPDYMEKNWPLPRPWWMYEETARAADNEPGSAGLDKTSPTAPPLWDGCRAMYVLGRIESERLVAGESDESRLTPKQRTED